MLETGDIVQIVAAKAVRRLADLEFNRSGEFRAYLNGAITNEIISQWRRADGLIATTLGDSLAASEESPFERLVGIERARRYEEAKNRLEPWEREAIVCRFELDYSYEDLARLLGKRTVVAARVAVHRAVKRLAEQARHV